MDELGAGVGFSATSGIRPSGRAPRGQGQEWKDRNAIANTIDKHNKWRSQLQTTANEYKGTKAGRWNMTYTKERVSALSKAISAATEVAHGPGDWGFKRELVDGIFDYAAAVSR